MNIYTYYQNINFSNQVDILNLWNKSWVDNGFNANILSIEDAKKSVFYNDFINELNDINIQISGKKMTMYGMSCYLRWLAYSTLETNEMFYVSDYDVINNGFQSVDEPIDKLNHLGGHCPCFARGTPSQFFSFCNDIIKISKQYISELKEKYNENKCVHYNDQEFLHLNKNIIIDLYHVVNNRKYISQYDYFDDDIMNKNLIHVSHSSIYKIKNVDEFKNNNDCENRIIVIKNILNHKNESI